MTLVPYYLAVSIVSAVIDSKNLHSNIHFFSISSYTLFEQNGIEMMAHKLIGWIIDGIPV